jgi:hypothetical protein
MLSKHAFVPYLYHYLQQLPTRPQFYRLLGNICSQPCRKVGTEAKHNPSPPYLNLRRGFSRFSLSHSIRVTIISSIAYHKTLRVQATGVLFFFATTPRRLRGTPQSPIQRTIVVLLSGKSSRTVKLTVYAI